MGQTSDSVRLAQGAVVVAFIALIVGIVALAMPMLGLGPAPQQQSTVLPSSIPIVDQKPVPRLITMEWGMFISAQDRWFPQSIVVNQGDTVYLTLIVNDTDGAHTFTIDAPTGPGGAEQLTQVNMTMPGQWMYHPPAEANPWNGIESQGPATNCALMGENVSCSSFSLTGGCSINGGPLTTCVGSWMLNSTQKEIAEIQASVTFGPLVTPGVYRYFCTYHQNIGMYGFLIVQPNRGYVPASSTAGDTASELFSVNKAWIMERVRLGFTFPQGLL